VEEFGGSGDFEVLNITSIKVALSVFSPSTFNQIILCQNIVSHHQPDEDLHFQGEFCFPNHLVWVNLLNPQLQVHIFVFEFTRNSFSPSHPVKQR
jgi:hypothetical protein